VNRVTLTVSVAMLVVLVGFGARWSVDNWPEEKTREELLWEGSCNWPFERNVKSSPGDRCAIEMLSKRCGKLDQCFVNCYTTGRGLRVGGGCDHICNYRLKIPWEPPFGINECYKPREPSYLFHVPTL
jgi:hypothetical protein